MVNSPSKLAAKIGSPGFLATHPNGKILYSVGRWDEGSGALGYHIGKNGELSEFTRMICPDGGSAHIAVHPSGKFLLTAQYGGGSVALFHLMQMENLVNPPSRNTKAGPRWWSEDRILPTPIGQDSLDGKYALIPDLGLDQIVIYKVDTKKPAITEHGLGQSVPGGGPRHMRFSTDGKFIYLLNELSLSVTTFAWNVKRNSQAIKHSSRDQ